jgi:BASS family bile acid:Na+ symporter
LAIAVGTRLFGGGAYIIPAATYSLIMFATALIFVALVRRSAPDAQAPAAVLR